uniref:Uncharacterized protein n=1 Tax=Acrobeloides nanus TaxID=290746 RepID=A0A914BVV2_9BILA
MTSLITSISETMIRVLSIFLISVACLTLACNIIVHVKSATNTTFQAQVIAPNGQKSEKWNFTKNREKQTFQQKADECGVRDWQIQIFDSKGGAKFTEKVKIDGIGRVLYEVKDDLKPVQVERQGAQCTGQCAPLA